MKFTIRKPNETDGVALYELVQRTEKLDTNSIYCNLLQLTHFKETAVVAEHEGEIVGSVTGYRLPEDPKTLFVWQVAVDPEHQGKGIASKMLTSLAERLVKKGVTHMETTITLNNTASRKLFSRFFSKAGLSVESQPHFEASEHFKYRAPTEFLYRSDLSQLES